MTAPFNPEELCDQTLIGSIRMLMKDDSVFPEIFSAAFENRNANNLVFSIPSDLSPALIRSLYALPILLPK